MEATLNGGSIFSRLEESKDRITMLPESFKVPLQVHRTIQELLGHKDVRTTMIYTHVLNRGGHEVRGTQPDGWAIVRFIQSV